MSKDLKLILCRLAEELASEDAAMQRPAENLALQGLRTRAKSELQAHIPDAYLRLLKKQNGIDWNGLTIYAAATVPIVGYTDRFIEGFVEANRIRRQCEGMDQFLLFGNREGVEFARERDTGRYVIIDAVSTDTLHTFKTFDQMVGHAIEDVL